MKKGRESADRSGTIFLSFFQQICPGEGRTEGRNNSSRQPRCSAVGQGCHEIVDWIESSGLLHLELYVVKVKKKLSTTEAFVTCYSASNFQRGCSSFDVFTSLRCICIIVISGVDTTSESVSSSDESMINTDRSMRSVEISLILKH